MEQEKPQAADMTEDEDLYDRDPYSYLRSKPDSGESFNLLNLFVPTVPPYFWW